MSVEALQVGILLIVMCNIIQLPRGVCRDDAAVSLWGFSARNWDSIIHHLVMFGGGKFLVKLTDSEHKVISDMCDDHTARFDLLNRTFEFKNSNVCLVLDLRLGIGSVPDIAGTVTLRLARDGPVRPGHRTCPFPDLLWGGVRERASGVPPPQSSASFPPAPSRSLVALLSVLGGKSEEESTDTSVMLLATSQETMRDQLIVTSPRTLRDQLIVTSLRTLRDQLIVTSLRTLRDRLVDASPWAPREQLTRSEVGSGVDRREYVLDRHEPVGVTRSDIRYEVHPMCRVTTIKDFLLKCAVVIRGSRENSCIRLFSNQPFWRKHWFLEVSR